MKKFTLFLLLLFTVLIVQAADTLRLSSPDKQIEIQTWFEKGLYYQIFYNNNPVLYCRH